MEINHDYSFVIKEETIHSYWLQLLKLSMWQWTEQSSRELK